MKTLDEVIDKFEKADLTWCNIRGNLNYEDFRDALHYLKEYKKDREDPDGDHRQLEKAQKLLWEFYQNEPLTWDELKQMKGKPVLVVVDGKERWRIIREVSSEHLILESWLPLHRCWMNHPDGWQAYRKER